MRPVIIWVRVVEPAFMSTPPADDITVYPVIVDPPLLPECVNVTIAWVSPAVAVPIVGAVGVVAGVIGELEVEALLVPTSFVANIVKVYSVPFESPVKIIDDELVVETTPALEDAL